MNDFTFGEGIAMSFGEKFYRDTYVYAYIIDNNENDLHCKNIDWGYRHYKRPQIYDSTENETCFPPELRSFIAVIVVKIPSLLIIGLLNTDKSY